MTLGIGLIGCGFIGHFHARNIRDIARSGANVAPLDVDYYAAAIATGPAPPHSRSAQAANSPPPIRWQSSVAERDAVYICTETVEHVELVMAAAKAGKHVFCEKPLATNLADARRMHAAVTKPPASRTRSGWCCVTRRYFA